MTTIEQIRLLIHDNNADENLRFFKDDELQFFYDEKGNIWEAARIALLSMASDKARIAKSIKIGAFATDESSAINEIRELAELYKQESRSSIRSVMVKPRWNKHR